MRDLTLLKCHGVKPPPTDGGLPVNIIDLDSTEIRRFFNGGASNEPQRADCLVIYQNMTAVMETKNSYPDKAIPQIRKTAELLKQRWEEFKEVAAISADTPRPTAYYFCVESGMGASRYEVDKDNNLRERSNAGKNKGPITYAEGNIPIKVYDKKDIEKLYEWYRG